MKVQVYVDRLFQGYDETSELRDFKEEIASNLEERVNELQANGMSNEEAFEKAVAELGDITQIADQISREKRNEVISRMYMGSRTPLGVKHAIGYALSGGITLFGLVTALITYFSTGEVYTAIAALMPFVVFPVSALVFLGLTQETTRNFPMPWKRALLYGIITGITLFGLNISSMLYFMEGRPMQAVLGTLIPFVIPGLCVAAFLILTEKSRHKPWVAQEEKLWREHYADKYGDPAQMEQRGLLSGALWLFAVAIFVALGFVIGFQYSWVVFIFAVAGEVLIEYRVRAKKIR